MAGVGALATAILTTRGDTDIGTMVGITLTTIAIGMLTLIGATTAITTLGIITTTILMWLIIITPTIIITQHQATKTMTTISAIINTDNATLLAATPQQLQAKTQMLAEVAQHAHQQALVEGQQHRQLPADALHNQQEM